MRNIQNRIFQLNLCKWQSFSCFPKERVQMCILIRSRRDGLKRTVSAGFLRSDERRWSL